jgi:hypothetical protein
MNVSNAEFHRTGWSNHQMKMAARGPRRNRAVKKQHMVLPTS